MLETTDSVKDPRFSRPVRVLLFVVVLLIFIGSQLLQTRSVWWGLALAQSAFVTAALLLIYIYGLPWKRALYLQNVPLSINAVSLLAGILLWFVAVGVTILLSRLNIVGGVDWSELGTQLQNENWLVRLLLIGLISVLGEELFFRGSLLFWNISDGVARAILTTTLVFVLIHSPVNMAGAAMLGFFCCLFVLNWNSILPALLLHFSYNILAPFLFITVPFPFTTAGWSIFGAGLLLLIPLAAFLLKRLGSKPNEVAPDHAVTT